MSFVRRRRKSALSMFCKASDEKERKKKLVGVEETEREKE